MKISRLEANKIVRRILSRHYVDHERVSYSCSASEARISGYLLKLSGEEFTITQVRLLADELANQLPDYLITGKLENWEFGRDYLTPLIEVESEEYLDQEA